MEGMAELITRQTEELAKVTKGLKEEYNFLYEASPNYTNPYDVATQYCALRIQHKERIQRCFAVHVRRMELIDACEKKLLSTLHFAKQIPDLDPALRERLVKTDADMRDMIRTYSQHNDLFTAAVLGAHGVPETAIPLGVRAIDKTAKSNRTAISVDTVDTKPAPVKQQPKSRDLSAVTRVALRPSASSSGDVDVGAAPKQRKQQQRQVKPKPVSPANAQGGSSGFQPVTKAAFTRLPRNLKIGAGKLEQVNEFYERVYNALVDIPAGLPERELLKATGEEDIKKFDVLRGLSVLRCKKEMWILPVRK